MPAASHASNRMTVRELLRLPEDIYRHELIDGIHYVTPSPTLRHQRIVQRIGMALSEHLREHPGGEVFFVSVDVVLSESDLVVPDILYISSERTAILKDQIYGAPDLVVEILSPSTRKRDEHAKRLLYDRAGVREYWIVDPKRESIAIYRRAADSFPRVAELSRAQGDTLTTPLLPEFSLALDQVFCDRSMRA